MSIKEKIYSFLNNYGSYLSLGIYIILIIVWFTKNPWGLVTKYNSIAIGLTLILGYLLVTTSNFLTKKKALYGSNNSNSNSNSNLSNAPTLLDALMKSSSLLGIIVGIIIFIFVIQWIVSNFSSFLGYSLYFVNALILFGLIAIVYKFVSPLLGNSKTKLPAIIELIKNIILYIPCLLIDLADNIAGTPKSAYVLLIFETILIMTYFIIPKLLKSNLFEDQFGLLLLDKPQYLNKNVPLNMENMENIIENSKNYHYGISSWIWINPQPPSTNPSYARETELLKFGEKCSINYDGKNPDKIIVRALNGRNDKELIAKTDIYLQKWNHVVINYDHGTVDVFVNGKLVDSKGGIVHWMVYEQIIAGTNNGIYGGIKNIRVLDKPYTKNQINLIYKGEL